MSVVVVDVDDVVKFELELSTSAVPTVTWEDLNEGSQTGAYISNTCGAYPSPKGAKTLKPTRNNRRQGKRGKTKTIDNKQCTEFGPFLISKFHVTGGFIVILAKNCAIW